MFPAEYAEQLEHAAKLEDEAFTIRKNLFHKVVEKYGGWVQSARREYTYYRREEKGVWTIDLQRNVFRTKGGKAISNGLEHLLSLIEGGAMSVLPSVSRIKPVGPVVLRPPYKVSALSAMEVRAHKAIPPSQEQLKQIMRYDEVLNALYYVNDEGFVTYEEGAVMSAPKYFIKVSGIYYARWRVISELWLGNPYGVLTNDVQQKALDDLPEDRKGVDVVSVLREYDKLISQQNSHGFPTRVAKYESQKMELAELKAETLRLEKELKRARMEQGQVKRAITAAKSGKSPPSLVVEVRRRIRKEIKNATA